MPIEIEENRVPTIFNSPLVCFFVSLFLFIALLYRQYELSLLAFLVLIVMAATKVWSSISHYRVAYGIKADKQRAFPGETLALETTIENAKLLPVRIRIHWALGSTLKKVGDEKQTFRQETGLLWYQRVTLRFDLLARRRGVYRIGPDSIRAGDFLGFFEKEKKNQKSIHIIVYPRLVRLKSIILPKRELFGVPGVKSPVKDPIYILGTRDYQPSRPSRHIHWKASARHLKLQEKIFEPSEQEKVLIALEVGSFQKNAARDELENTLEVIASLVSQLHDAGCAVGLVTNGILKGGGSSILAASRASGQLPAILEALARLQAERDGVLEPILRRALAARRGFSCAYFSYKADQTAAKIQKFCRQRNVPITFFLYRSDPASEAIRQKSRADMHMIDEIRIEEDGPV